MGEIYVFESLTVLFGLAVAYAPHPSDRPSRAKPYAPTFLLDAVPADQRAAHQQLPGFSLSFTGRRGGWKCRVRNSSGALRSERQNWDHVKEQLLRNACFPLHAAKTGKPEVLDASTLVAGIPFTRR
jgi:hypothetical protein